MHNEDDLFLPEDDEPAEVVKKGWPILIVDDEKAIHDVTCLALSDFYYAGKGLQFFHAYSGEQAKQIMREQPDIAMILLDVVMETEHAGLEVVDYIRNDLHNPFTRIILRTGQSGTVPERDVILNYDINDFKEKTELTAEKLFTVLVSTLRTYQDISHINRMRYGLKQISQINTDLMSITDVSACASYLLRTLKRLFTGKTLNAVIQGKSQPLASTGQPIMPSDNHNPNVIEPMYNRENCCINLPESAGFIDLQLEHGFDEADRQLLLNFTTNLRAILPCWQLKNGLVVE